MRRLQALALVLVVACATEAVDNSKLDGVEPDFALSDPGKADGVVSTADRARLEQAFDAAIASAEATVQQLESEIADLEAAHLAKQQEADALVAKIAQRQQELEDNYNRNLIICAFFPNPATCILANYLANDSTMKSYQKQLADAQAEQARIRNEIAAYNEKRDAIHRRIAPLRQGKQALLALLHAAMPPAPPPELANDPATAAAYWRAKTMSEIRLAVAEEVRLLVDLRNVAVELANTLDLSLRTLRKLEENVDKLVLEQHKQFMKLLAGLASNDPAAAAQKFLEQQVAARTRQLLNGIGWPLGEFARYLASSRGTGDLQALARSLLEKMIADAQPRIYSAETDVAIVDNQRVSSAITVSDSRAAGTIEVSVQLAHTFVGDLDIAIEHGGRTYVLQERVGGRSDGLDKTFMLDGQGVTLSGKWTLHIDDRESEDAGKLLRWELVAY